MNPQGQPNQPPSPPSPNGVPPVTGEWQRVAPQPTQWQPQPTQTIQQPLTPPSSADGQTPEYSIDYLNQIAPTEQKVVNRFAVFGLIGGGIIAAIFAVILLASSGGPSPNEQLIPISERIATLQSVTSAEQNHLTEDQISQANAALSSSLSSMSTSIQAIMKERNIKDSSGSSTAKAEKTYGTTLTTSLDNSYQRGTLDRTYTVQMTYELTVLRSRITKLRQSTSNKELLAFCDTSLNNIDIVLKAYASFDATKS